MPRYCETHVIDTPMWRRALCALGANSTYAPLMVSRHRAICASVLVNKLTDTLSLDYQMRIENRINEMKRKKLKCAA